MTQKTKSFDDYYAQIYPKLEELEVIRKTGAKGVKNLHRIGWISFAMAILLCFVIHPAVVVFLFIVFSIILFGVLSGRVRHVSRELRPIFKKDVISTLLNYFYEDVRYVPRQRINVRHLQNSLLFHKKVYRSTGDDFTECRIGNTYICFSEVQAYSRGESYFFNGFFIAIRFNKTFKSKTIVIPNSSKSVFRKISMNIMGKMKNASMVQLEDIVFNKEFDVISEDQVESRYLLSTSLMQRMLDYKAKVDKDMSFSFIDDWLYVAIPTNVNMFEASLKIPITDKEFIKSNYDYFELLTSLIEDLDLNTKIWR